MELHINFCICFLLGFAGILCRLCYALDKQPELIPTTYIQQHRFAFILTVILVGLASYFRDLFIGMLDKIYPMDGYVLFGFWLVGVFGQNIMEKIIVLGTKWFGTNGT